MSANRKSVSFNSLPSFLAMITVAAIFALPNSAFASYGWVMGSYKYVSSAESMILRPGFAEIGAVVVRTKALPYKRRIIAGCFATEQDAWAQRSAFVAVRKNNGIWLLKTELGCGSAPSVSKSDSASSGNSLLDQAAPAVAVQSQQVSERAQFKPKSWRFKGGGKIAYTDGTHPALFFLRGRDSSGDCYFVNSMDVPDAESIKPPQEESRYFFWNADNSQKCKVAYVYKVPQ